ncbi:hypothetical protein BGZ83_009143 [Gryganskiella cystojenkinii]|nr:hypothetical protein BGZ83_009143 [Gryganskiella cystojenkinii]
MSSRAVNDTTPLLGGNGSSSRPQSKRNAIQRRFDALTPLQSFIALIVLAGTVFLSVYFMLKHTLPHDLSDEDRQWVKFPRNAEDVQHLSIILEKYLAGHYFQVLTCFIVTYVALQAFAIPGSVMLSVLGGALFKFWVGMVVVLLCAGFGSLCCYLISLYLGHPIVEKYLKARIAKLDAKIQSKKDQLFFYFAFLRVTPFIPNWFMNVASPHLGIPIPIFFFGTLVGVLPNTLVTVQAGVTLAALASPDDFTLLTPQNIIMTIVIGLCLLLPIVLHRHVEDPTATPKAVDGNQQEDPLALHFDNDLPHYQTHGGVSDQASLHPDNPKAADNGVVTTPVLMWVEALEKVLDKMKASGFPFERVVSISGAAQQHGSVYWSSRAYDAFKSMHDHNGDRQGLADIFKDAFTIYQSPIWQDTSTTAQCQEIEEFLGAMKLEKNPASNTNNLRLLGQQALAERTGSRAYERYTGSQILKIRQTSLETYEATERISLVSSFVASLLLGNFASIDVADGSGMNLLDVETKTWDPTLTGFIARGGGKTAVATVGELSEGSGANSLIRKLGPVDASGRAVQGALCSWFVKRYGFKSDVSIITFTGDNPATVMAMKAEPGDAIVSLGTSDTLLLYTDNHGSKRPIDDTERSTTRAATAAEAESRLSVGYLCHPVDPKGFLMLYCAKNGSLARERVRDLYADGLWETFNKYLTDAMESTHEQDTDKDKDGDNDGNRISRILATGGASSNTTILQLLANVFGVPVVSLADQDKNGQEGAGSAAWGAARKAYLFGGASDGFDDQYHGQDQVAAGKNHYKTVLQPDLEQTRRYVTLLPRFISLERGLFSEAGRQVVN